MRIGGEYAHEAGERERVGHGEDAADSPLDAAREGIAPLGVRHCGWIAKCYDADHDPSTPDAAHAILSSRRRGTPAAGNPCASARRACCTSVI